MFGPPKWWIIVLSYLGFFIDKQSPNYSRCARDVGVIWQTPQVVLARASCSDLQMPLEAVDV